MAEFRPFVVLFEPKFVSKLDYQIKRTIIPTCRDCKFFRPYDWGCDHPSEHHENGNSRNHNNDDWFCADGVRKERESQ